MWFKCLRHDSVAKRTVGEGTVQVCFVWFFENISSSFLKIYDCDEQNKFLIVDPDVTPCPKMFSPLSILGIFVLSIYVFLPYIWLFKTIKQGGDGGWMFDQFLEDFKTDSIITHGWEGFNVATRFLIMVGSTIMFQHNRFLLHLFV